MKLLPLTLCLALASPAAAQPASTPGADALTGTKPSGEAYDAAYVDVYRFQDGAWRAVSGIDL